MKTIMIGAVSMLALSGCAVTSYPKLDQCVDSVYYAPELPGYATLGAIAGGIGLAMLSDGDVAMSLIGAGVGTAVGANAAGGLHTHKVCPVKSLTEANDIYTKAN
jgi:hypothetical protein